MNHYYAMQDFGWQDSNQDHDDSHKQVPQITTQPLFILHLLDWRTAVSQADRSLILSPASLEAPRHLAESLGKKSTSVRLRNIPPCWGFKSFGRKPLGQLPSDVGNSYGRLTLILSISVLTDRARKFRNCIWTFLQCRLCELSL